MRYLTVPRGSVLLWIAMVASAFAAGNLVPNGDFDKGRGSQPVGWSRVDGLVTSWTRGGNPGHCVHFDTNVQQKDKRAFHADPTKFKGKSKGGKYSTVGAHEGVWVFSAPIKIDARDRYFILEADVKGPARSSELFYPQVFVRGYQKFDPKRDTGSSSYFQTPHANGPAFSEMFGKAQRKAHDGDYLMVYRNSLVCRLPGPGKWFHYRMGIKLPSMKKYRPDVILLKPYAMWPLGDYYFDNIVLKRATKAEYNDARRHKHSVKGFLIKP